MLDLWHEAWVFSAEHALPTFIERQVHPQQLFGLETNIYAQELASVVVWIGYLQWLHEKTIGWPTEPILRKLDNIQHRDAILTHDAEGNPAEPEWPEADFVIGNPPFLGGNKVRKELGDEYVEGLFGLYSDRVPRSQILYVTGSKRRGSKFKLANAIGRDSWLHREFAAGQAASFLSE